MSSLVDFGALLTVFLVSLLGANALVVAFGAVLVGLGRYSEARAGGAGGTPYAALAAFGALVCLALIVVGLYAILAA